MQAAHAKSLVRRWFAEAMNSGSESTARRLSEDIFAVDFVDHDGLDRATNSRAQWLDSVITTVFHAFSDIEVSIEKLLAETTERGGECLVAVRYVFHGTHTGKFRGIAPTHRRIQHTKYEIYRIAEGRIAESWGEGNWLSTLSQLGAIPLREDEK
jgi:predicted ester cyclase